MNHPVLVTGAVPLLCLRSYCKQSNMKDPRILNALVITPDTAHLADHAVKFTALDRTTGNERVFIAFFKNAIMFGIYLTDIREISIG